MQRGWAVKGVIVFTSVLKIDSVVAHLQNDLQWDFREPLPSGAYLESLLLEMLQGFSHCPSSTLSLPPAFSCVLPVFFFFSICFPLSSVTKGKTSSLAFLALFLHSLPLFFSLMWCAGDTWPTPNLQAMCCNCFLLLVRNSPTSLKNKSIILHLFITAFLNVCTGYACKCVEDVRHTDMFMWWLCLQLCLHRW